MKHSFSEFLWQNSCLPSLGLCCVIRLHDSNSTSHLNLFFVFCIGDIIYWAGWGLILFSSNSVTVACGVWHFQKSESECSQDLKHAPCSKDLFLSYCLVPLSNLHSCLCWDLAIALEYRILDLSEQNLYIAENAYRRVDAYSMSSPFKRVACYCYWNRKYVINQSEATNRKEHFFNPSTRKIGRASCRERV